MDTALPLHLPSLHVVSQKFVEASQVKTWILDKLVDFLHVVKKEYQKHVVALEVSHKLQ